MSYVIWYELSTNDFDGRFYSLYFYDVEQSIANNSTTMKWSLDALGGNSAWYAERDLTVVIAGQTVYTKTDRVERTSGNIANGSITLAHNVDGTKSFSASIQAAVYGTSINVSGSDTFELDIIPRYALITNAPNFNDEQNPTITYSNPLGSGVDSVSACISFDGSNPDIEYRDISKTGTSYTFNLTEAERNILRSHITKQNSDTVYFYVRTIIKGEYFFSKIAKTLTIVNANPTLSPTIMDTNSTTVALTDDNSKFIRYFSNLYYSANAAGLKSATIDSITVVCGSETLRTSTGTFNSIETNSIKFIVVDSRGNTTTKTITLPMYLYIKLTCFISKVSINGDGELLATIGGSYYKDYLGSGNGKLNYLDVYYRVYPSYSAELPEWKKINNAHIADNANITDNGYTISIKETGLDYRINYVFEAYVEDRLMKNVEAAPYKVASYPVFDWSESDFNFNVPVHFSAGATGNIGDYGEWLPALNSTIISSYTTQKGWYQKLGRVITVGFYIKANCKSGYSVNPISIDGLPFVPAIAAAGGGMCSGAYVSSGFTFQCWVADTAGEITARVQQVNHTTATNLATSASGCFYRNNGGEITLSGTIIYITDEGES